MSTWYFMFAAATRRAAVRNTNGVLQRRVSSSLLVRKMDRQPDTVIYAILGINVGVFSLWNSSLVSRSTMYTHFTTSLMHLKSLKFHTLLTSTISHASTSHLLSNMMCVYFFGRSLIRNIGTVRFLRLYVYGGLMASCVQLSADYVGRQYFNNAYSRKVGLGASGSVCSILFYSIFRNPTATIYLYMILPVPAALVGVYFVGQDVLGLMNERSTVGNAAHLGGAAYGALSYFRLIK